MQRAGGLALCLAEASLGGLARCVAPACSPRVHQRSGEPEFAPASTSGRHAPEARARPRGTQLWARGAHTAGAGRSLITEQVRARLAGLERQYADSVARLADAALSQPDLVRLNKEAGQLEPTVSKWADLQAAQAEVRGGGVGRGGCAKWRCSAATRNTQR